MRAAHPLCLRGPNGGAFAANSIRKAVKPMSKKKRTGANDAAEDVLAKGSGKKFKKKGESKAGKIIGIVAGILAVIVVAGTIISYNIYSSGFVQRHTAAASSEHYEVTSSMMTYYFNSTYQNYVNTYSSYLTYMGLDTSKSLSEQKYNGGGTWYEQFMSSTKTQVSELLVLCEAARDAGYELSDDEKAEIDSAIESIHTYAKQYNVNVDYYIHAIYGSSVSEKDVRKCMEISTLASSYYKHLTESYGFGESDWDEYFSENTKTFLKVDYLTYSFAYEAPKDDTASDEETTAADGSNDSESTKSDSGPSEEELAALKGYADELAATTDADGFYAYVRSYLTNVKYAGMDETALEADNIDIDKLVNACLTEGATNSSETDLNTWLFDTERNAYDTNVEFDETNNTYKVSMILPASDTADLGYACAYRDNYRLADIRYIPVLIDDHDDDAGAKTAADTIYAEFQNDATEDNFAALASSDKYGDGKYEGGLIENADKGAISGADAVDQWVFSSDRKSGDCEIIHVDGKGYYIVYYSEGGLLKWQNTANTSLTTERYQEDLSDMSDKFAVDFSEKGLDFVKEVSLASKTTTSANASAQTAAAN